MTLREGFRWSMAFVGLGLAAAADTALAYLTTPVVALAAPVVLVATGLILWRPMVGVYLAVLCIPLYVLELPLGTAGLSPSEALLLLTAVATVGQTAVKRLELRTSLDPAHVALAGLIVMSALGLLVAADPFLVSKVVVLWTSFLIVSILVTSASEKQLACILVCLLIAGGVIGCVALLGAATPEVLQGGQKVRNRAQGTFTHPNQLAFFLLLTIPIAIALTGRGRPSLRLLALTAAGVEISALLLTFSRSGIIGLTVVFLVMAAWPGFRRVAVAAVLAVMVFSAFNLDAITGNKEVSVLAERLGTVTTSSTRGRDPRFSIYATTQKMIADRPWLGVGQHNFPEVSPLYGLQGRLGEGAYEHAHDVFLTIAVETGLPGLAFFVAFIVMVARAAWLALRRRRDAYPVVLALAAGLTGILVAGITEYPLGINVVMATILIEVGALVSYSRTSPVTAVSEPRASSRWAGALAPSPS